MRIVDLAAGVILGAKYQLLRLVGRGGYAEVWKALRLEDRCDVALKHRRLRCALSPELIQRHRRRIRYRFHRGTKATILSLG